MLLVQLIHTNNTANALQIRLFCCCLVFLCISHLSISRSLRTYYSVPHLVHKVHTQTIYYLVVVWNNYYFVRNELFFQLNCCRRPKSFRTNSEIEWQRNQSKSRFDGRVFVFVCVLNRMELTHNICLFIAKLLFGYYAEFAADFVVRNSWFVVFLHCECTL